MSDPQLYAKELFLTPTDKGLPRYSLGEIRDLVMEKHPSLTRLTISNIREWSRKSGIGDSYTWEELREIGVYHGVNAASAIPNVTWEEIILEKKAAYDRATYINMINLNMQASSFLSQAQLVPGPKDDPDTFEPEFGPVNQALQIFTITKSHIDKAGRR